MIDLEIAPPRPFAVIAMPSRAGSAERPRPPVVPIWAISREVAQQAAISLARNASSTARTADAEEEQTVWDVLAVPARPLELPQQAEFLEKHADKWERVQRETRCSLFWIRGCTQEADIAGQRQWRFPATAFPATYAQEAIDACALLLARLTEWEEPPWLEVYHLFCVPAREVVVLADGIINLELAHPAPAPFPPGRNFHTVSAVDYRRKVALSSPIKNFAFIQPAHLRDAVEQMHYRHAALRDEVVSMCYDRGKDMLEHLLGPHSVRSLSRDWQEGLYDITPAAAALHLIDGPRGWYASAGGRLQKWGVTEAEVHKAYHALRPVDILRFACTALQPEVLSEEVIQEFARRFPWEPSFLTYDPYTPPTVSSPMKNTDALRPWFTLHNEMWKHYTNDCREWAQGKAYGPGTVLPASHLVERPWLHKEFCVNVEPAAAALGEREAAHGGSHSEFIDNKRRKVLQILIDAVDARHEKTEWPTYADFAQEPAAALFAPSLALWTTREGWALAVHQAGAQRLSNALLPHPSMEHAR